MNKADLVAEVANRSGLTKAQAKAVVDGLFDVDSGLIAEALRQGDKVQISGFGSFEIRERAARTARNPRTGEAIQVGASKAPAFRAGKSLKEAIA